MTSTNYIKIKDKTIELRVDVVFKEIGGTYVSFAPALNLSGCGNSREEAKSSFEVVVKEYLKFTLENNTLEQDLIRHNWKKEVINKRDAFALPNIWDLIASTPAYQERMTGGEMLISNERITVPCC